MTHFHWNYICIADVRGRITNKELRVCSEDAIDDPVTEISILTMSDDAHVDTEILELSDDGANIDSDSDTEDEQVIPTLGAPSDTQGDRIDRITNLLETMMKSLSDYDTS